MAWGDITLTKAGEELLRQTLAGASLILDWATGGEGIVSPSTLKEQIALVDQRQIFSFASMTDVPGGKKVGIAINNPGLTVEYPMQQLGLWAHIGEEPSRLFAILQDIRGLTVPTEEEIPDFGVTFYVLLAVSAEARIQINLDPSVHITNKVMNEAIDTAVQSLTRQIQARPIVLIGGSAPATGPCLWFDTSQAKTQFAMLQIGKEMSAAVTAEIDEEQHSVDNAQLRTDPETGTYEIELL